MADPDDDRTVIRVPARPSASHTLQPGTQVGGLEITGLIGEGGFGIVYLAYDPSLDRQVAVKEYMPGSLAARATASFDVVLKSERHRETFEAGLKSFVNEAKLLARFDHPSLVKVFRFWEANRTAYMAMPFYEGPTLKAALRERGAAPDEAQLRAWLRPLLDALSVMHKQNCFHRDIAPDNILLTEGGPLLLDFGAARRVIGDMTQALTVVLKPGYAPIEQYGESATLTQGAWTDLYALASVVHYAILGRAPIASVERMMGEPIAVLAEVAAGRYSDGFLRAIDAALSLRPADRPQDVAAFRALLNAGLAEDSPDYFRPSAFQSSGFQTSGFSPSAFDDLPQPTARAPTVAPATAPAVSVAPGPRRGLLVAAGLMVLVGGAAGLWAWQRRAAPPAPPPSEAVSAPPPVVAAPAPVASAPAPIASPPAPIAPAPPPVASTPAELPAPAPTRAPTPARVAPAPSDSSPPRAVAKPARCSDILQKASLEPLTAEEADFLRSQCR